jgi:hypothetical protein
MGQGLFVCFVLLDRIGRRRTIAWMFVSTAVFTGLIPPLWWSNSCASTPGSTSTIAHVAVLNGASLLHPSSRHSIQNHECPLSSGLDWLQSMLLFGARACALAFNQALWIYTTELYPAQGQLVALAHAQQMTGQAFVRRLTLR